MKTKELSRENTGLQKIELHSPSKITSPHCVCVESYLLFKESIRNPKESIRNPKESIRNPGKQ
jgi:hypothetical protein